MIITLEDKAPMFEGRHYVAPGAILIGDVRLAADTSVWFNAVIRADNAPITIGEGSNVQDGAVLHVDEGFPMKIGRRVTIGHMAMLHGCTVENGCLIGIGAVVLNGAVIGENSLIGAKALVTEGMIVPPGSLVLGSPGKVARTMSGEQIVGMQAGAQHYIDKIDGYRKAAVRSS